MSISALVAFWGVSALFVITPGADWAYAITAGLRHRTVLPAVGGLLAGHLAATLAVTAGLAALMARSPLILSGLTSVGALYLLWLGWHMISSPVEVAAASGTATGASDSWVRQAVGGFGVSGLNPKVFLLFLALLPQFVDSDAAWPPAAQIVALGLVHVASCAVVYLAVGTGARAVLSTRPSVARTVTRLSGCVLLVIGSILLIKPHLS
jgi:threonine/homoserine/homoserine lactone efflux protein